jgi:cytochrome c oxidase subunit 2
MILGQVVGPALHNALDPAASQAASIAWLWWIFFWTTVAVCVGFAIAVFRKRTVEDAANDKRAEQIVGILVAIVVLILLGLLGADFVTDRAIASAAEPKDSDLVSIKVTGHQWWWEFRYQNSDPTKLFSIANEIHLPVGRVIHLDLDSEDEYSHAGSVLAGSPVRSADWQRQPP